MKIKNNLFELNIKKKINNKIFNKYIIIKKIGSGFNGVIYLVKDENNKEYAYKIHKLLDYELHKDFGSSVIRQFDFMKNVIIKYPNHFINIIDFYITTDCKKDSNYNIKIPKGGIQKILSNYCVHYFYSLIDTTFPDLIKRWSSFNYKVFYDLFLQSLYMIYIIKSHGYNHNDLHNSNIGLKITKDDDINILNYKIPTHGYYVQMIDYDGITNDKYKSYINNFNERYRYKTDFGKIIASFIPFIMYYPLYKKYNIDEITQKSKYYEPPKIRNFLLKNFKNIPYDNRKGGDYIFNFVKSAIYKIVFWRDYQKYILKIKPIKLIYPIDLNDIFFIINNMYEPKIILKHFLQKRDYYMNKYDFY